MKRVRRRSVAGCVARAALVPPAAFAVHQLRFVLAFGRDAGTELAATGHSYLHSLVPWIVLLIGVAAGLFLWALGRNLAGRHQTAAARRPIVTTTESFLALWLACSVCLLIVYCCQELLEGWFAVGHAAGFYGVFGMGGWWAIPASAGVGLVLAAIFHTATVVLEAAATHRGRSLVAHARSAVVIAPHTRTWTASPAPVAAGWSLRGPPIRS
jgi:hypothetical protein